MSSFINNIKNDAFHGNYLTRLLYLNIGIFLMYSISNAIVSISTAEVGFIPKLADDVLALPSSPWKLVTRPWTILTYMFTHFNFRHILFNMLILYFSGKMLME